MADKPSIVAKIQMAIIEAQAIRTGVLATLAPGFARNIGTYTNPHPDWSFVLQRGGRRGDWITDDSSITYDPWREVVWVSPSGSHGPAQETGLRGLKPETGQWVIECPSTLWADMREANLDRDKGRWTNTGHPLARHSYSLRVVTPTRLYCLQEYLHPDWLSEGALPYFHGRFVWWDFIMKAWGFSKVKPQRWLHASAACLDPVSQKIYIVGVRSDNAKPGPLIWMYDPVTDTEVSSPYLPQPNPPPPQYHAAQLSTQPVNFQYCPDDDKFYSFEKLGDVRRFTIDRNDINKCTAELLVTTGPVMQPSRPWGYPAYTWDDQSHCFGGAVRDNLHYEFDPTTFEWTATPIQIETGSVGPLSHVFACSAYDKHRRCYIILRTNKWEQPLPAIAQTWAFRP